MEEWKEIPGFNGDYIISNHGRIISRVFGKEKEIKGNIQGNGYRYVNLRVKKKTYKYCAVHRIVMLTFEGESNLHVNHIDGNKLNNKLENLIYCTPGENLAHAYAIGLTTASGSKNNMAILNERKIEAIRLLMDNGFKNKELAQIFLVSSSTMSMIRHRKRWV